MITSLASFLSASSFGRCITTTTASRTAAYRCRFGGTVVFPAKSAASATAVAVFTTARWLSVHSTLDGSEHDQVRLAREAIDSLAVTGKTWKRLGPVVSLATSAHATTCTTTASPTGLGTVADIGCDHGLLTFGLAATGRFKRVIGVDVSQQALQHGGWALVDKEHLDNNDIIKSKIEFVLGNGLQPIVNQQVDTICMAGLGFRTMQLITEPAELDRVACQQIVVQPTNSRPHQLLQLYNHLAENCGFFVEKEHISFLSNRWYISTAFRRSTAPSTLAVKDTTARPTVLPGSLLERSDDAEQRRIYSSYVEHHIAWLRKDNLSKKTVDPHHQIWLSAVDDSNGGR